MEHTVLPVKSRLPPHRNRLIFDAESFGEVVAVRVSIVASADLSIFLLITQAESHHILKVI